MMAPAATALQRGCGRVWEGKECPSADTLGIKDKPFHSSSTGWNRSRFPTADRMAQGSKCFPKEIRAEFDQYSQYQVLGYSCFSTS